MRKWFAILALGLGLYFSTQDGLTAQEKKKDAPKEAPKEKQDDKDLKVSVIKVIVPTDAEVELTIKGDKENEEKKLRTAGDIREFKTPPLDTKKKYEYTIEALIIPNNYTKITRPRKVSFVGGADVTVDLTKEDKELDKIVVRWVPTPDDIVDEMAKMAKIGKDDVVYDLGCGDAVMLIRPIKMLGAKRGVGIDIDEKMVKEAKERVEKEGLKDKIDIRLGDILDVKDMSDATVVMLYIGDDLGARLEPVLRKTLKPGSRVVSHRFLLGGWKPDKTVTVQGKDGDEYKIHLWEVPAK